jgi:uracil-DNA glycosylase family 4
VNTPETDCPARGQVLADVIEYLEIQKLLGRSFLPWSPKNQAKQLKWGAPSPRSYDSLSTLAEAISQCRECPLHKNRRQAVPGQGPKKTRIMLIGEGPGFEEDQQGKPFVGPAGQLLIKMVQAIQLNREEVFITNTVKCRPPGNRLPSNEEIAQCRFFLEEEIRLTDPPILVALGGCAARTLTRSPDKISDLRGRFMDYQGRRLMATYHPAFLLRNPEAKREAWEDLKKIRREYDGLGK